MGDSKGIQIRKSAIGPFRCYVEGKEFLGDQYGLFLAISLVGIILAGLVPLVLFGPAYCGIALCFLNRARGNRVEFDQLFKGFDYFLPSLIATLIYIGAATLFLIPWIAVVIALAIGMSAADEPIITVILGLLMALAYLGWIVVIGVASMLAMFAMFLIVDKKLEGPAAMKYAALGAWKNCWGVVATAAVGQLMVFIGTMMCIVPGLLVLPIVFAGHFMAYRKIFGVQMETPITAQVAADKF